LDKLGPRVGLDVTGKRKPSAPVENRTPVTLYSDNDYDNQYGTEI